MTRHPLVVLVDEDPSILVALTRMLMPLDVSLAWFTSASDALETVIRLQPSVVICGPHVSAADLPDFLGNVANRSPGTQRLLLNRGSATALRPGTTELRWPASHAQLRTAIARAASLHLFEELPQL